MARDEDQTRESQRIIERMNAQTDGPTMTVVKRATKRGQDHFTAADADQDDWIEVWGTRIGRGIGILIFLGLAIYLGRFVFNGTG